MDFCNFGQLSEPLDNPPPVNITSEMIHSTLDCYMNGGMGGMRGPAGCEEGPGRLYWTELELGKDGNGGERGGRPMR